MDLYEEQRNLEDRCRNMAVRQYREKRQQQQDKGQRSMGLPERWTVSSLCYLGTPEERQDPEYRKTLADLCDDYSKATGAGRRGAIRTAVHQMDPQRLAYITMRVCLDTCGSSSVISKVISGLGHTWRDEMDHEEYRQAKKRSLDILKRQLVKRGMNPKQVARRIRKQMTLAGMAPQDIPEESIYSIGGYMLGIILEHGQVVHKDTIMKGGKSKTSILPTPEFLAAMDQASRRVESSDMVEHYAPTVIPPKDWTTTSDGGYHFAQAGRLKLVRQRGAKPRYYETLDAMDSMQDMMEAVNNAQRTKWAINDDVYYLLDALWDSGVTGHWDLPSVEAPVRPVRPPEGASQEVMSVWFQGMQEWRNKSLRLVSDRVNFLSLLATARTYREYDAFHFVYFLDFRGRAYPASKVLTPQGSDLSRGLLQFAEGKVLTERGAWWLMVHLANCWGAEKIDKESYEDRVAYVEAHTDLLMSIADDPIGHREDIMEADSPFVFLAAVMDYTRYLMATERGEDYISHIPVSMDGSCSGSQHFAAVMRCEDTASKVNMLPIEKPHDLYTSVAEGALATVMADYKAVIHLNPDDLLAKAQLIQERYNAVYQQGPREEVSKVQAALKEVVGQLTPHLIAANPGYLDRKIVKRPTMTYGYALTRYGALDQINEIITDRYTKGDRTLPEGLTFHCAAYLRDVIWSAIEGEVSAAAVCMQWLRDVATVGCSMGLPLSWTVKDGFRCTQMYFGSDKVKLDMCMGQVRIRATMRRDNEVIDKRGNINGIAANWVHSLDACHLRASVMGLAKEGITDVALVHDSFGVHASEVDTLHGVLRKAFVDQYQECPLTSFRNELVDQLVKGGQGDKVSELPEVPSRGDLDTSVLFDARYFFS